MKGLLAAFVLLLQTRGAFSDCVAVEPAKAQPCLRSESHSATGSQTRKGRDSLRFPGENVSPCELGRLSRPHFYTKGYLVQ